MVGSYPSVYQPGHKAIADILAGPVVVEEKVDGSQFSFCVIDGELQCRSKGKQLILDAPEKMFATAVRECQELAGQLHPGWVYRGEYLQKPKHNALSYGRTPWHHIILFDIVTGVEDYVPYETLHAEANRLDLEAVPLLYSGIVTDRAMFNAFLERESVLGGTRIEGVVIKNYALFTQEHKVAMAKYVREGFKEVNDANWKNQNPGRTDIIDRIIARYRTDARWKKAVQHLRENGELTDSPKDIGPLLKEVRRDVEKEEAGAIAQLLFGEFWPEIARKIVVGLPEWYKESMLDNAFKEQ
jgi:hypothetical protein